MSSTELNYRREHFRTASVPLVFDREGRPCQLMIFNTWTFERDIAAQMHARGKLMFANAVLWQFAFPAPLLDVLGTEVNWLHQGEYLPDTDAVMNFRRALCRQKPYCLLMNTDYARFTPELVERYFQRCLFPATFKSRNLGDVRPGGLGIHFIKSVVDKIEYDHPPEGGMLLKMIKFRPRQEIVH